MSKPTPGPWTAVDDPQDGSAENWYIITDEEDVLSLGLSEANARLIAAAPDLLAALKHIDAHGYVTSDDRNMVCAVIAKAEGAS